MFFQTLLYFSPKCSVLVILVLSHVQSSYSWSNPSIFINLEPLQILRATQTPKSARCGTIVMTNRGPRWHQNYSHLDKCHKKKLFHLPILQVDQAARNLLNGIRMQELSQDKSWKLGTRPRPEPSKWITKVRPKTKSISFLVSIMKPKKLIVTDPNGEITTEICTIHKDQIASLEVPIEFQDGDDQDGNHKNLCYPNLDKPI